jgi:hypothetical protein
VTRKADVGQLPRVHFSSVMNGSRIISRLPLALCGWVTIARERMSELIPA